MTNQRAAIADSYLDHIIIALSVGDRSAPFRTFLDNWYAFTIGTGHLTAGDRPIWFNNPCARKHSAALRAMHFVSGAAAQIIVSASQDALAYDTRRSNKDRSVRLMVDHIIPLRTIVDELFRRHAQEPHGWSREDVRGVLNRLYKVGVITDAEDTVLRKKGLRSAMPLDWDGVDPLARYLAVGITGTSPVLT